MIPNHRNEIITKGLPASSGVSSGKVVFDYLTLKKFMGNDEDAILVLKETSANDVKACTLPLAFLPVREG